MAVTSIQFVKRTWCADNFFKVQALLWIWKSVHWYTKLDSPFAPCSRECSLPKWANPGLPRKTSFEMFVAGNRKCISCVTEVLLRAEGRIDRIASLLNSNSEFSVRWNVLILSPRAACQCKSKLMLWTFYQFQSFCHGMKGGLPHPWRFLQDRQNYRIK